MRPEGAMKYSTTQTRLDQIWIKLYKIGTDQARNGGEQTRIQDSKSDQNCINHDGYLEGGDPFACRAPRRWKVEPRHPDECVARPGTGVRTSSCGAVRGTWVR
jgi:hypothetical protein